MKKNKRFSKGVVALLAMLTLSLGGCGDSTPSGGGGGDPGQQTVEDQIKDIYKLYVAASIASGEQPKSYEEWLATIKGEKGDQGNPGNPGQDGKDGATILYGSGEPTSSLGKTGDSYIDYVSWDFYVKEASGWIKKGSLKGEDGAAGTPGTPGQDGKDGTSLLTGSGAPAADLGKTGDSYVDLDSWDFYVKGEQGWNLEGNIKGPAGGPQGPQGEQGVSITSIELISSVGLLDTYQINYSDGSHDTFTVTNGADGESIKGEPGEDGHTPVITVGSNGNWYVDNVDTGIKAQGPQGPIGPAGPQGPAGENGIDGEDGTSLLTGSGAPSANLGKAGDSYVDLLTWDFYVKDANGWHEAGNIKGKPGQDGENGHDGENGKDGKDGTSFRTGYGVPSASLGINGDSYLNLTNYDLYVKSNGEWVLVGNISGGGTPQETYIVTYVANGGSGTMEPSVVHSSAFILPECDFEPALGETFVAWTVNGVDYQPTDPITLEGDTTVTAKWAAVSYSLTVAVGDANPYPNENYPLTITCTPTVSLSNISVTSSDPTVLTIANDKQSINTLKAGVSTITATYEIGVYEYSKSLEVTVYERPVVFNPVAIDFYAFNDMHGNVIDSTSGLGLERTTTLLKKASEDQNAIFVSQGDMWQGSCESNSTHGELVTKWMNQIGFASITLGNHEYDWGKEYIAANASIATFPTLGINVIDKDTGERASYADASVVVEKEGVKIGIIGAIGDCYSSISGRYVKDVRFAQGNELSTLVKAESTRLRQEEGCDFIVYSVHDGNDGGTPYSGYDLTFSSEGYVDVVFEGHSHSDYRYQDVHGVWHMQGGGNNRTFNNIQFNIDPNTGEVEFSNKGCFETLNFIEMDKDADTTAIFNQYDFESFYESIGINNTGVKNSDKLRQDIADLYLAKGLEKWSSSYLIALGGGYISCRDPFKLPQGEVTYAQLYNLFPFDNDVVLCSIDGEHLKSQFLSLPKNYFISVNPAFDTSSIVDNQTYYVVTDTYSSDYAPNHLTEIAVLSTEGYYQRDFLRDYIASGAYYQEDVPVPDPDKGTALNPYTIDEAYAMANNSSQWAWFKGKVSSLDDLVSGKGYMQNVRVQDEGGVHSINIYKLWEYDGSTRENNFVDVDSEVLFFGSIYIYNDSPNFGGVCVAVSVNGGPTTGLYSNMPASVCQYMMMTEAHLQAGQYVSTEYVHGKVTLFSLLDDDTNRYSVTITSKYVDNSYTPYTAAFAACISDALEPNLAIGSEVTIRIDATGGINDIISCIYTGDGTLAHPYSVGAAIDLAKANGTSTAGHTPVYCKGTVSRQSDLWSSTTGDLRRVYIQDSNGNEMFIYYLKKCEGANLSNGLNFASINDLQIGDEIVIYGIPYNYGGNTPEFASGTVCFAINGKPTRYQTPETAMDISTLISLSTALGNSYVNYDWSSTYVKARVTYFSYNEIENRYDISILSENTSNYGPMLSVPALGAGVELHQNDTIIIKCSASFDFEKVVSSTAFDDSGYYVGLNSSSGEIYVDLVSAENEGDYTQVSCLIYGTEDRILTFYYNGEQIQVTLDPTSFNSMAGSHIQVDQEGRFILLGEDDVMIVYLRIDSQGHVVNVYFYWVQQ